MVRSCMITVNAPKSHHCGSDLNSLSIRLQCNKCTTVGTKAGVTGQQTNKHKWAQHSLQAPRLAGHPARRPTQRAHGRRGQALAPEPPPGAWHSPPARRPELAATARMSQYGRRAQGFPQFQSGVATDIPKALKLYWLGRLKTQQIEWLRTGTIKHLADLRARKVFKSFGF